MYHRVADFHSSGIPVEQKASGFLLQQQNQVGKRLEIRRLGNERCGRLTMEPLQGSLELNRVGDFDSNGHGPEDLFLQQLVPLNQQNRIRLEKLRVSVSTFLRGACQMADARVSMQCGDTSFVAA